MFGKLDFFGGWENDLEQFAGLGDLEMDGLKGLGLELGVRR